MARVLCIGDLHEPFCLPGYLDFCVSLYDEWECNRVVFIGDVIDNHFSSYHETDSNAYGGAYELEQAIEKLSRWYELFDDAMVTIGNHDALIMRKAQSGGITSAWIREFSEVLNTPGWEFVEECDIDGVQYLHGHGGGGKAVARCVKDMQSTIQGHYHTESYVQWKVGRRARVFGMQVGCGIDRRAYAMAYAKAHPKPAISAGIIIDGETAVVEMMPL